MASCGNSNVGAVGVAQSSESSQSSVLGFVVLVGQTLDGLGGMVNFTAYFNDGSVDLGLRVGLSLGDTVVKLVLDIEGEDTSVSLFGLLFLSGNTKVGVGGGSNLRGAVQVVQRVGIVGELLSVELNKVTV